MADDECKTCLFWSEWNAKSEDGDCVRYPPTIMVLPSGDMETASPETHFNFWCGEYVERQHQKEPKQ